MRSFHQFIFTLLLILLASCSPLQEAKNKEVSIIEWAYADLRALDPSDTQVPAQDIIAAYIRYHPERKTFQIRLDFLDLTTHSDLDIYIAIDNGPGGSETLPINTRSAISWDTLIVIPISGPIQAITSSERPNKDFSLRVIRDTFLDTITVELKADPILARSLLGFNAQLFTTAANSQTIADLTDPFHSSDPPPDRGQIIFGFWNTFPAYTPAQSLRRWDGAHTGPYGGRHGLYNLLKVSRSWQVPIALLDLKYPPSLSALEYAGGLDTVSELVSQGLLILPDVIPYPFEATENTSTSSSITNTIADTPFSTSPFLYQPFGEVNSQQYPVLFTNAPHLQEQLNPIYREGLSKVIPIPDQPSEQATPNGPSLDMRRALINSAIKANNLDQSKHKPVLFLGGNLPQSTWGDPVSARATMSYIAQHPWIQPLTSDDILSYQLTSTTQHLHQIQPAVPITTLPNPPYDLPDSPISLAAWNAYLALFAPLTNVPPEIIDLRSNYTWIVDALIGAAQWDANPIPIADCEETPQDNYLSKCILATKDVYAIFEPRDGSLVFAFARSSSTQPKSAIHQIIGPSSQFIVGVSEPSTWDLEGGPRADPSVISGAFTDDLGPYQVAVYEKKIVFRSPNAVKTYRLKENGVDFEFQGSQPTQFQIPLVVDPWRRFTSGWGDCYNSEDINSNNSDNRYMWGVIPNEACPCSKIGGADLPGCTSAKALIASSSDITPLPFTVTRDLMGKPENPNTEFPPGHYLPFPIALIHVSSSSHFRINISIHQ